MRHLAPVLVLLFAFSVMAEVTLEESQAMVTMQKKQLSDWTPMLAKAHAVIEDYWLTRSPARCLHVSPDGETERYYQMQVWSGEAAERWFMDESPSPPKFHLRMDKKTGAFASDFSGKFTSVSTLKRRKESMGTTSMRKQP